MVAAPTNGTATPTPEQVLQRLDWQVVRRLDGLLQGDYRTLFRGAGVDFADLREYQPTDDARYIDWNVTARMNTPYVRAYLEATGESDDRWQEHVPPVMLSALMLAALLGQVVLPLGVMHTGQEHEMHRAVRIGEVLTITVLVAQYSTRRGALMAAFDAEARAGGEVVAVSRASVLVPPPEETATAEESAE